MGFNFISSAPLAQVNNYFDNTNNVEEKMRERTHNNYSHSRLSDAAYQREYEYPEKHASHSYLQHKSYSQSTNEIRPSTAKHSYRSSSIIPSKSKVLFLIFLASQNSPK